MKGRHFVLVPSGGVQEMQGQALMLTKIRERK